MYSLNTLISEHQNKDTSLLLICGDFNAKVGTNNDDAECVGRFSRGHRNLSGQCLIDFCNAHKLFITNSAFKHKAAHITTWESTRINKTNNTIKHIYNQIDYVICPADQEGNLRNARSYNRMSTFSDHRIVLTRIDVQMYKIYLQRNKKKKNNTQRFDISKLVNNPVIREQYQQVLKENLAICNKESWNEVSERITKAAEKTIGFIKRDKYNKKSDSEIDLLSNEQKKLRLNISKCDNHMKMNEMKTSRNNIMHQIQNKICEKKEKELDKIVSEIEKLKIMLKCIKLSGC